MFRSLGFGDLNRTEAAEVEPRSCRRLERGGFKTNTANYYSTKQAIKK